MGVLTLQPLNSFVTIDGHHGLLELCIFHLSFFFFNLLGTQETARSKQDNSVQCHPEEGVSVILMAPGLR